MAERVGQRGKGEMGRGGMREGRVKGEGVGNVNGNCGDFIWSANPQHFC
jgi:hypothetical protein